MSDGNLSSLISTITNLLRSDFRRFEYGRVILPFTFLRWLDCVLEPTKAEVLAEKVRCEELGLDPEPYLLQFSERSFYNTSQWTLEDVLTDQGNIEELLLIYVNGFSAQVRDIFEKFNFDIIVNRLADKNLLETIVKAFVGLDLGPNVASEKMSAVFESLIRIFSEMAEEVVGSHYTPRDVISLMVKLLFIDDESQFITPGEVRSIYDPAAGTGGMLSAADEFLMSLEPNAHLKMFGQEINADSYAICKASMLIRGQDPNNIVLGNTLTADCLPDKKFDYMLSSPPLGFTWKHYKDEIYQEVKQMGNASRFSLGLPRVNDGSFLFLLHMTSKMRSVNGGGCRIGILLNESSLIFGDAGSGESEIRRHILENDLLEAIISLPTKMFFNTGIRTYLWILSNRKLENRKGKVQLIDASGFYKETDKQISGKHKELSSEHADHIKAIYQAFEEVTREGVPISRIFRNESFGYRIRVIDPQRSTKEDNTALGVQRKRKRRIEKFPLHKDEQIYLNSEMRSNTQAFWTDSDKSIVGYEIPFDHYFLRSLNDRELNYVILGGRQVQTVFEVIIGNLLYVCNLHFSYNIPLTAADGTIACPAFTIHYKGLDFYWEHFTREDTTKSGSEGSKKRIWYERNFPDRLLVTVGSTELSTQAAKLIEQTFPEVLALTPGVRISADVDAKRLILHGEGEFVEFKQTARWDVKRDIKSSEMENAVVKTVAAFLNTNGGNLFIGVTDSGEVVGLSRDLQTLKDRPNIDGFCQWLTNLFLEKFGKVVIGSIHVSFPIVNECQICRVDVERNLEPVYVNIGKEDQFFIRANNTSHAMPVREAARYILQHWKHISGGFNAAS